MKVSHLGKNWLVHYGCPIIVRTGRYVLPLWFLSYFQYIISEVPRPIANVLSYMLGSECNFRNLGPLPQKFEVQKHENQDPILDNFPT